MFPNHDQILMNNIHQRNLERIKLPIIEKISNDLVLYSEFGILSIPLLWLSKWRISNNLKTKIHKYYRQSTKLSVIENQLEIARWANCVPVDITRDNVEDRDWPSILSPGPNSRYLSPRHLVVRYLVTSTPSTSKTVLQYFWFT